MKNLILVSFLFLITHTSWARSGSEMPTLAVSQGISSPAITSPVNYSKGFTHVNSAVAASLTTGQISLEYDTGDDDSGKKNSGFGAELGYGNGTAGAMAGYYDRDCNNCDGKFGGLLGIAASSFSFGVGYREDDNYSAGLLINQNGNNRFGITAEFKDGKDTEKDLKSYGVGYSYNANTWIFALDASKQDQEDNINNDIIQVTPGLLVNIDWLSVSVSYDMYLNDKNDIKDDKAWFGAGFRSSKAQLAIYHDYINDWSFVGTFWF